MNRFTYFWVEPGDGPKFKKIIRFTRGEFVRISEPMGCFGFRYAIFRNRASEVLIPLHDLTPETKLKIA